MTLEMKELKQEANQTNKEGRGSRRQPSNACHLRQGMPNKICRCKRFFFFSLTLLDHFMVLLAVRIEMSRLDSHAVIYLPVWGTKKRHCIIPPPVWLRDHARGKEGKQTRGWQTAPWRANTAAKSCQELSCQLILHSPLVVWRSKQQKRGFFF